MHCPAAVRGKGLGTCALPRLLAALQQHTMGTDGTHAARACLRTYVCACRPCPCDGCGCRRARDAHTCSATCASLTTRASRSQMMARLWGTFRWGCSDRNTYSNWSGHKSLTPLTYLCSNRHDVAQHMSAWCAAALAGQAGCCSVHRLLVQLRPSCAASWLERPSCFLARRCS